MEPETRLWFSAAKALAQSFTQPTVGMIQSSLRTPVRPPAVTLECFGRHGGQGSHVRRIGVLHLAGQVRAHIVGVHPCAGRDIRSGVPDGISCLMMFSPAAITGDASLCPQGCPPALGRRGPQVRAASRRGWGTARRLRCRPGGCGCIAAYRASSFTLRDGPGTRRKPRGRLRYGCGAGFPQRPAQSQAPASGPVPTFFHSSSRHAPAFRPKRRGGCNRIPAPSGHR